MKSVFAFSLLLIFGLDDYKIRFNNGLEEYNKEHYSEAISNFSKSYELKKHSKTLYYIAISYFKLGEDSLAEKFARLAEAEDPKLADAPYQRNLQHIWEFCELAPRFRKVRVKIEQSAVAATAKEKKEQDKIDSELSMYYPSTPEGQMQVMRDFNLVQSRSLLGEGDWILDKVSLKLYRKPITDSL